jgi:8-oxo-dGTP diphosphatase
MVRRGPAPDVRAAGGVVWRHRPGGQVEVALVHRPRYDDWSLPKGKLDEGETELVAGVREVGEELGSRVAVTRRIGDVTYQVVVGTKTATYWVMRHLDGTFTPTAEVDDVRWLSASAARGELTYAYDRRIVADFAAVPLPDSMILLVRHAKAGKRSDWRGPDMERPLERAGEAQAERLAALLALFLADSLGLTVRVDPVFGDESYAKAPQATEDAVIALAKPGHVTVVSSQGDAIPGLIDQLGRGILDSDTKKAAFWALSVVDGSVVSTDYYDDALR